MLCEKYVALMCTFSARFGKLSCEDHYLGTVLTKEVNIHSSHKIKSNEDHDQCNPGYT